MSRAARVVWNRSAVILGSLRMAAISGLNVFCPDSATHCTTSRRATGSTCPSLSICLVNSGVLNCLSKDNTSSKRIVC